MNNLIPFPKTSHEYTHANVHLERDLGAAIIAMNPEPRPSFTPELLDDLEAFGREVAHRVREETDQRGSASIRYAVVASDMPDIYNFGGDLHRFVELIRAGDRQGLLDYALACVRCSHTFSVGFDLPVTSIALVQGRAQGGGFEAALACNVLIAEKGTHMGFPEVLFNLFPGMGAYSFLSRKVSPSIAERLILSGRLYEAEELHEMGVVDVLAEPGAGWEETSAYIKDAEKHNNVHGLMQRIRTTHNRVPFEELRDITELWVESAMQLTERELRTMERLVRAQDRRLGQEQRQVN